MSKTVTSRSTLPFNSDRPAKSTTIPPDAYSYLHHLLEAEKVRLSRDLHDGFGQELVILKIGLEEIMRANHRTDRLKAQCRRLLGVVDHLFENVRRVSMDLHPSRLEEAGLFSTLEWYLPRFAGQTGLQCRWRRSKHEPEIQPERATQIFRIVQEAITNVARHAKARSIEIVTSSRNKEFALVVQDDGKGIEEEKITDHRSIGLRNMKERARLVGGRLEVSTSHGKGTSVRLTIPLQHCSAAPGTPHNQEIVRRLNETLAEQLRLTARGKATQPLRG